MHAYPNEVEGSSPQMNNRPASRRNQPLHLPAVHGRNGSIPEIILEENELGRPHSPRQEVQALMGNRYNPGIHTDLDVSVTTGTGTAGEIILAARPPGATRHSPAKIYDIAMLSQRGNMRVTVKITLELDAWRQHERDWMNALMGQTATLKDPGVINSADQEYEMRIQGAQLYRKTSSRRTEPRLIALMTMEETVPSALRRARGTLAAASILVLVTAVLTAVLTTVLSRLIS